MTFSRTLLPLLVSLTIIGCEDDDMMRITCADERRAVDPSCLDYDPCLNVTPQTAAFKVRHGVEFLGNLFYDTTYFHDFLDGDTVSSAYYLLEAEDNADEYEWAFNGTDIRRTGKSIYLDFPRNDSTYSISLSLTTTVVDPNNCLPPSQRSATLTREFVMAYEDLDTTIRGTYLGRHCDSEEDSHEIRIVEGDNRFFNVLDGFPRECFDVSGQITEPFVYIEATGNKVSLATSRNADNLCAQVIGIGEFSLDRQSIMITYQYTDQDGSSEERCWEGTRL